jgi:hypothetical protein
MSTSRGHRWIVAVAGVIMVGAALSGCVPSATPAPSPTGSEAPTPVSSQSAAPPSSRDPILRPGESAAANQQFFDFVNAALYSTQGRAPGQTIVDNLVANGFVKADMEVTPDTTAIGKVADSVVVSVRINGECLIGQFGATQYTGIRAPLLGTGSCLVGRTRPIDW